MARHPADDQLLDVVEGTAAPDVRGHVEGCAACRARVEAAGAGYRLALEADVPEPSPPYWEAFRRQVGRRVDQPAPAAWGWRPVLAATAALAALFLLLPSVTAPPPAPEVVETLPAWSPLPEEEDAGLEVLRALEPDVEVLRVAAGCRGMAECVAELNEEESRALADELRADLPAEG
jgi:predicted anti-sigma-YlaC factor YlaD